MAKYYPIYSVHLTLYVYRFNIDYTSHIHRLDLAMCTSDGIDGIGNGGFQMVDETGVPGGNHRTQ